MNPWRSLISAMRTAARSALRARRRRIRRGRYRATFDRHRLLRATPDPLYPRAVRTYWRQHYGRAVHPFWHIVCANVTGREDVRYIPTDTWFDEILPFFNRMDLRDAYIDKNLANLLLGDIPAPRTTVRRIHGEYYDPDGTWITPENALTRILDGGAEQVIKPGLTDNGVGITLLNVTGGRIAIGDANTTLNTLERSHGADFIIQPRISQHAIMAAPHPSSVNTIRLLTFRWNGDLSVLLAFARFGVGGRLTDNASTGGVCCGLDPMGRMNATAVDKRGAAHTRHPTTGYDFAQRLLVPGYQEISRLGLTLHQRLPHFDLVSWDFAVDEAGAPVFIEFNVRGAAFIYQFAAGKPLFGDLTTAVLERIRDRRGQRFDPPTVIS